jgi:hypothetical protein
MWDIFNWKVEEFETDMHSASLMEHKIFHSYKMAIVMKVKLKLELIVCHVVLNILSVWIASHHIFVATLHACCDPLLQLQNL